MACVAPEHKHDVLRIGEHTAGAPQIVRHRDPRPRKTLRRNVSERIGLDLGQPLSQRPQPRKAGEAPEIG